MPRYWRVEEIEKLIALASVRPCLWDADRADYADTTTRYAAYKEIGNQMGLHPEVVRSKFRNLRAQYFRIHRDPEKRYSPKRWIHYDALCFLKDDCKAKGTKTLTACSNEEITNGCGFETDDLIEVDEELVEDLNSSSNESQASSKFEETTKKVCYKTTKSNNKRKTATLQIKSAEIEKDAHTIFGEHVANELRALKYDKRLQLTLKCAIIKAILQANQALIS